jgi:outer membrane protein OmpA-like peptidoglycan-associated protein
MPVTGLYIGAGVGANWLQETDLKQSGNITAALRQRGFAAPSGKASFDTGIATFGSVGWGFGNGLRAEGEFSYRWNDVNKVKGFGALGTSGALVNLGGEQQSYGLMFNLLYDFEIPGAPWVVPYIGAGLGMAWTQVGSTRSRSIPANISIDTNGDTQYNFAYQAMVGAAFPIDSVPGLAVTTDFRFFGTPVNKFTSSVSTITPARQIASGDVKADNFNYALTVGLRYNFGRVPPPPPVVVAPAPAPAPARTYLVFFDWDRADLTARAREIITEAAQNAGRVQTTRIEVAGHADRSGSPAYNQRLSQRRADAVAAELVARGISRNEISVSAYGESRPLVPTADGVREPQNRRVEIVLR